MGFYLVAFILDSDQLLFITTNSYINQFKLQGKSPRGKDLQVLQSHKIHETYINQNSFNTRKLHLVTIRKLPIPSNIIHIIFGDDARFQSRLYQYITIKFIPPLEGERIEDLIISSSSSLYRFYIKKREKIDILSDCNPNSTIKYMLNGHFSLRMQVRDLILAELIILYVLLLFVRFPYYLIISCRLFKVRDDLLSST